MSRPGWAWSTSGTGSREGPRHGVYGAVRDDTSGVSSYRAVVPVALVAFVVVALVPLGAAPPAAAEATAEASITFDVGTGRVYSAHDERTPHAVASTIKLLTALIVRANTPMDDEVTITPVAADVSPLKLTMEPGSRWRADDLLHAMLIASLNDAAVALAIHAGGGSLAGYDRAVAAEVRRLGLRDHPRVYDPSGLDGEDSVGGGDNVISARDLAIVTRAFLGDPLLAEIVRMPSYEFDGGDGRPHIVYSHNAFLDVYPDAIGVKTGYTDRAGHSLVAAATRDGRTIATVVVDSPAPVEYATAELDAAFATDPAAPATGDVLPAVGVAPAAVDGAPDARRPEVFTAHVPPVGGTGSSTWTLFVVALGAAVVVGILIGRVRSRRVLTAAGSGSDPH